MLLIWTLVYSYYQPNSPFLKSCFAVSSLWGAASALLGCLLLDLPKFSSGVVTKKPLFIPFPVLSDPHDSPQHPTLTSLLSNWAVIKLGCHPIKVQVPTARSPCLLSQIYTSASFPACCLVHWWCSGISHGHTGGREESLNNLKFAWHLDSLPAHGVSALTYVPLIYSSP